MTSATLERSERRIEPPTTDDSHALQTCSSELLRLAALAKTADELLQAIVNQVQRYAPAEAALYCRAGGTDDQHLVRLFPDPQHNSWSELTRPLTAICQSACRSGQMQIHRLASASRSIVAMPIVIPGQAVADSLAWAFSGLQVSASTSFVLHSAVQAIALWHGLAHHRQVESEANDARAIIELLERMGDASDVRSACSILARELENFLHCKRVAVGIAARKSSSSCRLAALSDAIRFDQRSGTVQAMEAALDEAVLRNSVTRCTVASDQPREGLLAHRQLAAREAASCVLSSPLCLSNGQVVGGLLLVEPSSDATEHAERFLSAAGPAIAKALACMQRLEGGKALRVLRASAAFLSKSSGKAVVAASLLAAGSMAIPLPARIHCRCQIEPTTRRFVAAPFDGTLEKSFVQPSDIVRAGAVLAQLDGREIRWRRASVEANLHQAQKKRDVAQASHNYADQQIAQLEMERLKLELELLDYRADNLEIKSPIDGVVVAGDWQRAQGAPLKVGQSLFEIGPLEKMVVEVAVPDEEIARVTSGQIVTIGLDAYPNKSWQATLGKIEPRSEIRDENNVFVAEAELDNLDDTLRPGMKGQAKVTAGIRPLGWILFHKPWEFAVKRLSW